MIYGLNNNSKFYTTGYCNKNMVALYQKIQQWLAAGEKVALATVIKTWGSSPCSVGSQMAIAENGEFTGAVSAGCVESAVIENAASVFEKHRAKCLDFNISSEDAFSVGLACGGQMQILLQPFSNHGAQKRLLQHVLKKKNGLYLMAVKSDYNPAETDEFFAEENELEFAAWLDSEQKLRRSAEIQARLIEIPAKGMYFLLPVIPPFRLVIIGGSHIAKKLTELAAVLGYEIVIIDPRSALATESRFPHAASIFNRWPENILPEMKIDDNYAMITLSHDDKIDDAALIFALQSNAGYIGALGSKKTHAGRIQRLQERGFGSAVLKKIHAPVGLDIAAKTPEEIALSILAEIIQFRRTRNAGG